MLDVFLEGFTNEQLTVLMFSAVMVGVSKTGVPGVGILSVPLMAMVVAAKASTGLLLLLLAMADMFAVLYYRRHAQWKHVLRLLPWALAGIGVGSLVIRYISDDMLRPVIGLIVMAMLIINFWLRRKAGKELKVPHQWYFAATMGFAAGLTTQLANAAGPVLVIYLLAMQLSKEQYMGTLAWYCLIINWLKIPLFIWDGRITMSSLKADIVMLPAIAVGAALGIFLLKKMPQKWFNIIIQFLAVAAAVKLIISIAEIF
ncbi:MAG: sulfite exporter TauE/SafE family protein [Lentisphaerae bacterium]|nr:sulfite exporter TauE/SafE family protein [Lentisphaerota bacterium]MCP4101134.1 sulfite exporter TauE/SafE family protein [Lentisphaerota bacterium]